MKKTGLIMIIFILSACYPPVPAAHIIQTYPIEAGEAAPEPTPEPIQTEAEPIIMPEFVPVNIIDTGYFEPVKNDSASQPESLVQHHETDFTKPMIALTFDDGPVSQTLLILDILEKYNVRATFCVIGRNIRGREETIQRAFDMGNEIIGHSWNHQNLSLISAADIKKQITDTHALIESIIGEMPHIYRPPYGIVDNKVRNASEEAGFAMLKWSVDPRDWEVRNAESIYQNIMKHTKDGSVILCHDTYDVTVKAMERVIPELINEGYELVTVSELLTHLEGEIKPGMVYHGVR